MAESGSLIGESIDGIYVVRRLIGQGGMGEVYEAQAADGSKVALKLLHERTAREPEMIARFQRESAIAAEIRSPFVAGIKGTGRHHGRRFWIAFEHLVGETLEERLRADQYLSFHELLPIVDDVLQGLIAAHAAGVVHRDIKPGNLFLENRTLTPEQMADGEPHNRTRILDFGISKLQRGESAERTDPEDTIENVKRPAFDDAEPSLTAFDATLGSFSYMAPEQVGGSARVDARADLYALGVVAFRTLTGRLPFDGANGMGMIALKLNREAPTLTESTGNVWPELIEFFMRKMLSRERDGRFSTATEALMTWRNIRHSIETLAIPNSPRPIDTWTSDDRTEVTLASSGEFGAAIPPSRRRL